MKLTVERMPQSSVALDIVADDDEFKKAMDRAFRKINQQVRIPGFRPGKAPRQLVEQRIGRELIVDEAHREIMDGLYRQALEQEDIVPVSDPSVDVYQNEPIGFRVEIQVYPTVDLGDYTSVRVEPREVSVTDEDIDQALKELQEQHSVWVEPAKARKPADGDQVIADLQAFEGDEPFQEPVEDATFMIGDGSLFPQIEESLKQLRPGKSAEFDIEFAEDDEKVNPDLRGKTLHYKLALKEIKERELPEIDDELAKTAGEHETLDDLKAALRKDLLRNRAMQERNEVVNEAIAALAGTATADIPAAMVDRQIDQDIQRLQQSLAREGMSFEEFLRFGNKTEAEYRDEMREDAERRVLHSIVLDAFAKEENLEVTETDLLAEIDRMTGSAENREQMREVYSSPYFQRMIMDELANRVLTDRLIEITTEGVGAITGEGAEVLQEQAAQPGAETVEVSGEVADSTEEEPAAESDESDQAEETQPADEVAAVAATDETETATEDETKENA